MKKMISLGMTLNMGNYQTIRVDCSAEADQLYGETTEALANRLGEEASKDLARFIPQMKEAIKEM